MAEAYGSKPQHASPNHQQQWTGLAGSNNGGNNVASASDPDALERLLRSSRRGKKGDCPFCGTKLFKVGVFGKLTPLTEKGTVSEGTCLKCFQQSMNVQGGADDAMRLSEVPHVLAVPQRRRNSGNDNATIVSGITLDSLVMSLEESGQHEYYYPDGTAVGDTRRSPMRKSQKFGMNFASSALQPPSTFESGKPYAAPRPPPASSSKSFNSSDEDEAQFLANAFRDQMSITNLTRAESNATGASSFFDNLGDCDFILSAAQEDAMSMSLESAPKLAEVSGLVVQMNEDLTDKLICVDALKALASIIWVHGATAEIEFAHARGMEALTRVMWHDITDHVTQEAALHLLVALTAPREGKAVREALIGEGADGCVDALLITMQTLKNNAMIQETGCTILCFLASACVVDPNVNDGTASGAVLTVLGSMEAHEQSVRVQEWGVRALYQHSVFSKNAEGNKRTLVSCKLASGVPGLAVVRRAFVLATQSPVLQDRLCKLYWSLSAEPDVAEMISPIADTLGDLLSVARDVRKSPHSANALEAALGAVANFTKTQAHRNVINADATIALALDVMRFQMENAGALTEACCLISNLVFAAKSVDALVVSGAIDVLINAMISSQDDPCLVEEGMRALVGLCEQSESTKDALVVPMTVAKLLRLQDKYKESPMFQHLYCLLLYSMCRSKNLQLAQLSEILGSISSLILVHLSSERVQDAVCSVLRMLSQTDGGLAVMRSSNIFSLVVAIMDQHKSSKVIQLNACCILWNVTSKSPAMQIFDTRCVGSLVRAIQTHLECSAVVELACSALWSLIYGSDDMKAQLVETEGGIDALTCVLVMHPTIPVLLESAVGVLSSLSASKDLAKDVVSLQCIEAVSDVLRNNGRNRRLLHFCTLFLKNSVVVKPEHVATVKEVIPVVLKPLKEEEVHDPEFQMCACAFLMVVASASSDCRAYIVSLDGVRVLLRMMETSQVPGVRDAAVCAFNKLI